MTKDKEFDYLIARHPELVSLIRLLLEVTVPAPVSRDQQQKTDD